MCVGRSHGIHAEPTTFGLKLLTFYEEFYRNYDRLNSAIKEISTCAISGAVGTFANVDPWIEKFVAYQLCSHVARVRLANMVDTLYSVVAKFPKKYLPSKN